MTTTLQAPPVTESARPPRTNRIGARTRERIGLALLLVATAVMYLWNITVNGMGNQFYAGAAWAGSTELGGAVVRVAGPAQLHHRGQAAGVAVGHGVVRAAVRLQQCQHAGSRGADGRWPRWRCSTVRCRRISGPRAALLAGAALALTPVAALMFRYNNPDAAMVLLMTAGAYCTVRALHARERGLVGAGRGGAGIRLPCQDARRIDGDARASGWCICSPRRRRGADGCCICWARWRRSWSRRAGSWC